LPEIKKENKKIISSFSNLRIYLTDSYPESIDIFQKLSDAVNLVDSKYCVICADDDFVTIKGINESVDFLENHKDFSVAHGYYISFDIKSVRRKTQKFYWRVIYNHKSNTFEDTESRLKEHLSNYPLPTLYAVHRTNLLKLIFNETIKFSDDVHFGELLSSMLTLVYGKMKCLDVLYMARDGSSHETGTLPGFSTFMKEGIYECKYEIFKNNIAFHLNKNSLGGIEESKKVVDEGMSAHLVKFGYDTNPRGILRQKIRGGKNILSKQLREITLKMPDWVYEDIRPLYRRSFFYDGPKPDEKLYHMDDPSSKYYEDFDKIRSHVLKFHSKV
jgi:glycosyltransferase domain-containing protein